MLAQSEENRQEAAPKLTFPKVPTQLEAVGVAIVLQCNPRAAVGLFGSVAQSCPTLCDAMDCSTPGFPVHHQLLELAQTQVHLVGDAIQPSHPLGVPFSSCPQSFPESGSLPVSQFFASGGQSIGASAVASVLPVNIQD